MRAGINTLAVTLAVGVVIGLAMTPDGRAWLSHPTLLFGNVASASAPAEPASPPPATATAAMSPAALATPLDVRLARGRLRIGVFGDSMGDGLYSGLYRQLNGVPGVTLTRFSEVSTGLSRYDYVDIQAKTERQIAETPVDVAVILFGTNDAQGISADGQIYPFGSAEWKAAYGKRVEDLVRTLRARDIAVYWVGLPRMKRPSFDEKMNLINGVVSAKMAALGVPYLPTQTLTSDAEGDYQAYLSQGDSGRPVLMRANDGIHMSMSGYLRIAGPVTDAIRRDAHISAGGPSPEDA